MHIVNEDAWDAIDAVLGAVRKDPDSWQNWYCLKIEALIDGPIARTARLQTSIHHLIKFYLKDKHGTSYMPSPGQVHLFCRDVDPATLSELGERIVSLTREATGVAGIHRLYALKDETNALVESYEGPHPTTTNDTTSSQNELPFLPVDPAQTGELSNLNAKRVLLVEDDPVTRWMVKMALKNECRLCVVSDAHKALAAYNAARPDLVLLDIDLPGIDGRELMNQLFEYDPAAHIVMFSSNDSLETMVDTIESGAKAFISKPFERERLIQCINECPIGH